MTASVIEIVGGILASFYGFNREWSLDEIAAVKTLQKEHGWTPSRASFIGSWIGDPDNERARFWKDALTKKNGILMVLKSAAQIAELSGVDRQAPSGPGWQAYDQKPQSPEEKALAEEIGRTHAQKRADKENFFKALEAEGRALGLEYPPLSRWILAQWEERRPPARKSGALPSVGGLIAGVVK